MNTYLVFVQALTRFMQEWGIEVKDNPMLAASYQPGYWAKLLEMEESENKKALRCIVDTLEDDELEDFDCLDQIIAIVQNLGYVTCRHEDF